MMRDVGVQMDSGQRRGANVGDTRRKIPTSQSERARAHEPPSPLLDPWRSRRAGRRSNVLGMVDRAGAVRRGGNTATSRE